MTFQQYYPLAIVLLIAAGYRWLRRSSFLSDIPGPKPELLWGNVRDIIQRSNVDVMLEWQEQFGSVFRFQGFFGLKKLVIADTKALQYILNTAAYDFPRPQAVRDAVESLSGPTLVWAEGETHKKQRRLMSPAFGARESKQLLPVFRVHSEKLATHWESLIDESADKRSTVIDVHNALHSTTLDALCEASFDFQTNNENGELLRNLYMHFNEEAFPPNAAIVTSIIDHLPTWIVPLLLAVLPTKQAKFSRMHKRQTYKIAKELVADKAHSFARPEEKRSWDIFSLLVQANASEHVKNLQLTDNELYAQMGLLFIAGHDTTASTLTFALRLFAVSVDCQTRLRSEIRAAQIAARRPDLSADVLENMPYLQAVLKEALRLYPAVFQVPKVASKDSVIPLSRPVKTLSGKMIDQIAVPKGTHLIMAIGSYNRNKDVWGDDADAFNPDRWLKDEPAANDASSIGVIGNILTFYSGPKSCLGWRFAMVEMQCFLVEIIDRFELRVADSSKNMRVYGDSLIYPIMEGEEDKGAQIPLRVSIASRD